MAQSHNSEAARRIARELVDSHLDNQEVHDSLRQEIERLYNSAERHAEAIAYGEATAPLVVQREATEAALSLTEAVWDHFTVYARDDALTSAQADAVLEDLEATLRSI